MNGRVVVDLLRHGACEGGAIYRGSTDSPLSAPGREAMDRVLARGGWTDIFCSPLGRCRLPAEHWARVHDLPLKVEPDLREMDFGAWEGRPLAEVWSREQARVLAFWDDPAANGPPGAESLGALEARTGALLARLAREAGDGHPLLVTHGGVIRVILCRVLGLPLRALQQLSVDNASLSRIELYPEPGGYRAQLIFCNRLEALADYDRF